MIYNEQTVMNGFELFSSDDDQMWEWLITQVSAIAEGKPYEKRMDFNTDNEIFRSFMAIESRDNRIHATMECFGFTIGYSWRLDHGRLIDFNLEFNTTEEVENA